MIFDARSMHVDGKRSWSIHISYLPNFLNFHFLKTCKKKTKTIWTLVRSRRLINGRIDWTERGRKRVDQPGICQVLPVADATNNSPWQFGARRTIPLPRRLLLQETGHDQRQPDGQVQNRGQESQKIPLADRHRGWRGKTSCVLAWLAEVVGRMTRMVRNLSGCSGEMSSGTVGWEQWGQYKEGLLYSYCLKEEPKA